MKQLNVLLATIALTSLSMAPTIAKADDHELEDLDVTMDVVDNLEDIDDIITEMPGPEEVDGYFGDADVESDGDRVANEESDAEAEGDGEGADVEEDSEFERQEDEFVTDEDFTEVDESFDEEGDFEEGDDIDDDSYDMPMPEDDGMDDGMDGEMETDAV